MWALAGVGFMAASSATLPCGDDLGATPDTGQCHNLPRAFRRAVGLPRCRVERILVMQMRADDQRDLDRGRGQMMRELEQPIRVATEIIVDDDPLARRDRGQTGRRQCCGGKAQPDQKLSPGHVARTRCR
jgi:hypothetical protein